MRARDPFRPPASPPGSPRAARGRKGVILDTPKAPFLRSKIVLFGRFLVIFFDSNFHGFWVTCRSVFYRFWRVLSSRKHGICKGNLCFSLFKKERILMHFWIPKGAAEPSKMSLFNSVFQLYFLCFFRATCRICWYIQRLRAFFVFEVFMCFMVFSCFFAAFLEPFWKRF